MGNRRAGVLLLLLVLLPLEKGIDAQTGFQPKPLCLSQYTLANRACAFLRPHEGKQLVEQEMHELHGSNDNRNHVNMEGGEQESSQRHQTHHLRRQHHHHHQDTQADECCRWLKNMDSECVCDILQRLPLFLSKLRHDYTIEIEDSCTVVYGCGNEEEQ